VLGLPYEEAQANWYRASWSAHSNQLGEDLFEKARTQFEAIGCPTHLKGMYQ